MDKSVRNSISEKIHWTTSEEMLFTSENKYSLVLEKDFPLLIKFYQFTSAHPVIPNYHDFFEISYFYSGKGLYHLADLNFDIQAGNAVLIQSGQMHNIDADPDSSVKTASIYFMPELVYHPGSTPHEYNYLLPFLPQVTEEPPFFHEHDLGVSLWESILEMFEIMHHAQNFYQLDLKNRLCEILLIFLKKMKYQHNMSITLNAPINRIRRLDNVFSFIQAEYAKLISLEQLAEIACMSPAYFCRFFKGVTGLSPIEYILRYRIDKAKELLINSEISVTEISFQVGFNSQSYFDRVFQRFTKLSPRNFRQSYSSRSKVQA